MSASKVNVIYSLKHTRTAKWISNSIFVEVANEAFSPGLPFQYRLMRFLSRSNHLRNAAIRYQLRNRNQPIKSIPKTAFNSLSVQDTVNELNEKGFATGIVLPPDYLTEILAFCAGATFIDDNNKEPMRIGEQDEANPRPGGLTYRCANPHKQCETVDKLTRDPAIG